jgi:hypothetical protein
MKQEQRIRKLTVRLTRKEYEQLEQRFKGTTCSQLSQYIRSILLSKQVVVKYRNTSLDDLMEEIILLRKELQAIGNNYNQAVKKLHTLKQISEFRQWIANNEVIHQQFNDHTKLIQQRIDQVTAKWLEE